MSTVLAMGYNLKGECGQGENPKGRKRLPFRPPILRPEPMTVLQGDPVDVQVGSFSTHVINQEDTEVVGGGYFGQWCNGHHGDTPAFIPNKTLLGPVRQVSVVGTHTIALLQDGTTRVCGSRGHGEWGNGDPAVTNETAEEIADTPLTQAPYSGTPAAVIAGAQHMAVLMEDGTYDAWGYNKAGALGDGTFEAKLVPTKGKLDGVKALALGGNFSLALTEDGTVHGCGRGHVGQLGQPLENRLHVTARWLPIPVPGPVVAIAAAGARAAAITQDGDLFAWGEGSFVPRVLAPDMKAISVGCYDLYSTMLALTTDNAVLGIGRNPWGQLGDGTRFDKTFLTPLGVKADVIRAGETHSALLVL